MQELTLTKTRLFEGVWEGILTRQNSGSEKPQIEVTHLQNTVPGVEIVEAQDQGQWVLRVPVPVETIADGVQTFLITDKDSGDPLSSFSLAAGDALSEDIRAEVTLLREELDMLKRAFRRHCLETT
ncbi:MAG: hypothetical protein AAGF53_05405 [Pseudomonadota bacterium]